MVVRMHIPTANPKNYISVAWTEKQAHWFLQQTIASMWDEYTGDLRHDKRKKLSRAQFLQQKDPTEALKMFFGAGYNPFESKSSKGLKFKIDDVLIPNKNETEFNWFDEVRSQHGDLKANDPVTIECYPEYEVTWTASCDQLGAFGQGETKEQALDELADDIYGQYQVLASGGSLEEFYDDGATEMALVYQEVFGEPEEEAGEVREEEAA